MKRISSADAAGQLRELLAYLHGESPSRKTLAGRLEKLAASIRIGYDTPSEKIKKALDQLSYLTNAVAAWVDAHNGNRGLADSNAKKVRAAEELLSEVMASMPAAVNYWVYGLEGVKNGPHDLDGFITMLKGQGIKQTGYSSTTGRLRPELKGQPTFDKLLGPMYDGPGKIRYETSETYDALSR